MKNLLYLLLAFTFIVGCSKKSSNNEFSKDNLSLDSIQLNKEKLLLDSLNKSKLTEVTFDSLRNIHRANYTESLFLSFKLGITKKQYEAIENRLIQEKTLFQYSASGLHAYTWTITNKTIWVVPEPIYSNNKLSGIKLICWDSDGGGGSGYYIHDYYNEIYGDSYIFNDDYYWFKNGLEVRLTNEPINNDPYPDEETGVVYLTSIK